MFFFISCNYTIYNFEINYLNLWILIIKYLVSLYIIDIHGEVFFLIVTLVLIVHIYIYIYIYVC